MTTLSTDELSPLEQFILKHDLPDFQADQVREHDVLVDVMKARHLGVMARTRIQKQVDHLASVRQSVARSISDAQR